MGTEGFEAMSVFGFLAVGAIALFTMITVTAWSGERRKEREAYYKNDMLKKVAESQGPGAASAIELLREENRIMTTRRRQELKTSGLIVGAAGLGMIPFLYALIHGAPIYMVGFLVLLVGAALFGSSYVVTVPE
ncbi:MAG TPA: hypothetical protein VKT75_15190 [Acidobacteriaceae bacterium]|nr:hypothetical protein [Acidobacteriaceae bacterium]